MKTKQSVSIARTVNVEDIRTSGSFPHSHVLDLRESEASAPRAIEEPVLKRLKNHFIKYDQMPLNMEEPEIGDETNLYHMIKQRNGDTLIVTDHVAAVAEFCRRLDIPFTSKVFYVVETGRGDVIKHIQPKPIYSAKFGTFAG